MSTGGEAGEEFALGEFLGRLIRVKVNVEWKRALSQQDSGEHCCIWEGVGSVRVG